MFDFGAYESQMYEINSDLKGFNNTEPFEIIFLNRDYKPDFEYIGTPKRGTHLHTASVDTVKTLLEKTSKFTLRKDLGGISMNISGPIFEDVNGSDNVIHFIDIEGEDPKKGKLRFTWHNSFPGTYPLPSNYSPLKYQNLVATISPKQSIDHIFNLLGSEFHKFMINLAYGSVEGNRRVLAMLDDCRRIRSHSKDSPISYSLLALISPRTTMTGLLKKGKTQVELRCHDHIIVTADRNYFTRGSNKVIYVNFAVIVAKIQPGNYIHIDEITLRVIRRVRISLECLVVQPGILRPRSRVNFPCDLTLNQVTVEEIQDITFVTQSHINTLAVPVPGCNFYYNSLREVMTILESSNFRIFAQVSQDQVCSEEYAKWIADTYDGIILSVNKNPKSHQIIRFTNYIRFLIERCYNSKKVVIMSNYMPKECTEREVITVSPEDQKYFFFYADSFLLHQYELSNIHLERVAGIVDDVLARTPNYAMEDLILPFEDKSLTGSDSVARAVVRAAYDINASAIIVCTVSGRMVEKIAHFRPKCPIIALTKDVYVVRYLQLIRNVFIAFYREPVPEKKRSNKERQKFILKKLFCGLIYGVSSRVLTVDNSSILFGYRKIPNVGYPNTFTKFKISSEFLQYIFSSLQ